MTKLTKQQKQVYDYLQANEGATVREIHRGTYPCVDKVSARLSELGKIVEIEKLGRNKHREMMYRIAKPLTKKKQHVKIGDGVAKVWYEEVPV